MQFLGQRLKDPIRQFELSLALLGLLVGVGTLGYAVLEGMNWIDALYMTVITLTTVGFGEVHPLSPAGRLFTTGLIVLGVGAVAWALRNAVGVILGADLWLSVRKRRMRETIDKLEGHYLVCGYGRMGRQIVRDLTSRREPFVVIDLSEEKANELLEAGIPHVLGDATQEEILQEAGVERAAGVVTALDTDADTVLSVLTARGMNPNLLIVARAAADSSMSKLHRAGADRVVSPYITGGHRMALSLLRPVVHDFLNHIFGESLEIDIGQITVSEGSTLAGQTLARCDLRRVWNLTVIAIRREDGTFDMSPSAEHQIEVGETLIVIGPGDAIYSLEEKHRGQAV